MTYQYSMYSGIVHYTVFRWYTLVPDMIEPSPKNVITARLHDNGYITHATRFHSRSIQVFKSEVAILPDYPSLDLLLSKAAPWWTRVAQEDYIPVHMLKRVIKVKEDKWEEGSNDFSVFWANHLMRTRERYGLYPKSVRPKQKFAFVEYPFARAVLAGIVNSNSSMRRRVNKISCDLQECVENEVLRDSYEFFLASLARAYSTKDNQEYLSKFLKI